MFCKYCGRELPDQATFCSGCGRPVDYVQGGNAGQSEQYGQQPYQDQQFYQNQQMYQGPQGGYGPNYQQTARPDGYAIASLVLGILGLIFLPLVGGILAIVFGNISMRNNGITTMARAGKILGIIAVVWGCIAIVVFVIMIAFVGALFF